MTVNCLQLVHREDLTGRLISGKHMMLYGDSKTGSMGLQGVTVAQPVSLHTVLQCIPLTRHQPTCTNAI